MNALLNSLVVQRIGWTLLHSLWQEAAIALLLAIVLLILRRRSPGARYAAGCLALALMVAVPAITFSLIRLVEPAVADNAAPAPAQGVARSSPIDPSPTDLPPSRPDPRVPPAASDPAVVAPPTLTPVSPAIPPAPPLAKRAWIESAREALRPALPWVVSGWLAGMAALSIWHLGGWIAMQRMKLLGTRPAGRVLEDALDRVARRMGIRRAVALLESVLVESPIVYGLFRPVILIPACILTGLSSEQLEAILAHELAHIRRHDYLVNLLQTIAETLLFYHPATWWISRRIRAEREHCADDLAVSACANRRGYVKALAAMEELRMNAPTPALAATGGDVLSRIRRLLGIPAQRRGHAWLTPLVCVAVLIALAGLVSTWHDGARAAEGPATTRAALSARDRIGAAVTASKELFAKAEHPQGWVLDPKGANMGAVPGIPGDVPAGGWPRVSHMKAFRDARPWFGAYVPPGMMTATLIEDDRKADGWPSAADAPGLREMAKDKDPLVRSLAIEALGALRLPDDLALFVAAMDDRADGAPLMGCETVMFSIDPQPEGPDGLVRLRKWYLRTVGGYAREALRHLTGQDPNDPNFKNWLAENGKNIDHQVWYWQERLNDPRFPIRESLDAIAQLPPDTEAQILLLATRPRHEFTCTVPLPLKLRISRDRLVQVLKDPTTWKEIAWTNELRGALAHHAGLSAGGLLTHDDIPVLEEVLKRERKNEWQVQAALLRGISQLLPAAQPVQPDNPNTRQGFLRQHITEETDRSVRGDLVAALLKTGWQSHWEFIKNAFFGEPAAEGGNPTLRATLIWSLPQEGLDEALVNLLLDPRFKEIWLDNSTGLRYAAIGAVNMRAKRQLITDDDIHALANEQTAPAAIPVILAKIAALGVPATRPAATQPNAELKAQLERIRKVAATKGDIWNELLNMDRFGEEGFEALAALMDEFHDNREALGRVVLWVSGNDSPAVDRRLVKLLSNDPGFTDDHPMAHLYRWFERFDVKLREQSLDAALGVLDSDRARLEARVNAAMLLGRGGRAADGAALRKRLGDHKLAGEDFTALAQGGPRSIDAAMVMGLAKLGDADARGQIAASLDAKCTPDRVLWAIRAVAYVADPRDVSLLAPVVRDGRPGEPLMFWDGRTSSGSVGAALDVWAAETIYAIARPKPEWSFKVGPPGHLRTEAKGKSTIDTEHDKWVTLSDEQRREIEEWVRAYKAAK